MLARPVIGAVPDCLQVDAVTVVAVEVSTPLAVGESGRVADGTAGASVAAFLR